MICFKKTSTKLSIILTALAMVCVWYSGDSITLFIIVAVRHIAWLGFNEVSYTSVALSHVHIESSIAN